MADPLPSSPQLETPIRPIPVTVGVGLALVAAAIPLLPESVRPWNFAMFGAVALFLAARCGSGRMGLPLAALLVLGAKLGCDLVLYSRNQFDPDYVPAPSVYVGLAGYAVLGWLLLRQSRNPLRIASVTLLSSFGFFVITNTVAWLDPIHAYSRDLSGLLTSYTLALPFWRDGTLVSDLGFSAVFFAAEYLFALTLATNPAVAEPIPVTTQDRR